MSLSLITYPDSVRFLYSLGNEARSLRLGLERISTLLHHLGNPHRGLRCVHVAGTNGKGSVCAMMEAGLRAAGLRTGLFTSPHLAEPTERIRVAGVPVTPEDFSHAFETVHRKAEALLAQGALDGHPTYFETVTAMAFLLFRDGGAEAVVLETGLGGRLDATNVVVPALSVITPVDYDHEAYLGKGLASIAAEKAGIVKPGVAAVTARQHPEVMAVLQRRAAETGSRLVPASAWTAERVEARADGNRFTLAGPLRLEVDCPLAGEHQVENAITAVAALHELAIPADAMVRGLGEVRWPGRLERVRREPEIVLDGAHNPAGARALARHIERFYAGRRVHLVYGAMRDKAVAEVAGILFPLASEVILTAPGQPRAVRPETIRELAGHDHMRLAASVDEALEMARGVPPGDAVFLTGSLYLVGEARARLVQ